VQISDAAIQAASTFEQLYNLLPDIHCRGKCHTTCGQIDMTDTEHQRIVQLGHNIPRYKQVNTTLWRNPGHGTEAQLTWTCPALTFLKTCAVYEARPLICRLYGLYEGLACMYGCLPEGGLLPGRTAHLLFAQAAKIDGDLVGYGKWLTIATDPQAAKIYAALCDRLNAEYNLSRMLGGTR
jgi:Fe-S-cluster containining protein